MEISDPLLRRIRKIAARERVTLRSLIERGLRQAVSEADQQELSRRVDNAPAPKNPFKLRNVSFKGNGLRPELRDAPWSKIRDMIYEGRGGDPPSVPQGRS